MNHRNFSIEEDLEWDSTPALCPFCGANPCSNACLRSPNHASENISREFHYDEEFSASHSRLGSTSNRIDTPQLSLAIIDEIIAEADDDDEEDEKILYAISKSLMGANEMTEELKSAKRQLEVLMMHHLQNSRNSRIESDFDSSGPLILSTECSDNDNDDINKNNPLFITNNDSQDFVFRVDGEPEVSSINLPDIGTTLVDLLNQGSALALMRSRVSQLKRRYQQDNFDLDLSYITSRIIAMGFPSWGAEKYYRNPIEEVELFLETKHSGHYRIYNLCSERPEYDSPKRFNGRYKNFPFDDHNVPCPINLITDFIFDATNFLKEDQNNVVVVHCKAGKGRTGLMISCLLRSLDPIKFYNAKEALCFFGKARTYDGFGVTIPSQSRYVHYYDRILNEFSGKFPSLRALKLYQITIDSNIKPSGSLEVYFTVKENGIEKIDSRNVFPNGPTKDPKGFFFLFPEEPKLQGDLKFSFFQRNRLVNHDLFHFWINTSLCDTYEQLSLKDKQLDGRPAKKKDDIFCEDLAVNMIFLEE